MPLQRKPRIKGKNPCERPFHICYLRKRTSFGILYKEDLTEVKGISRINGGKRERGQEKERLASPSSEHSSILLIDEPFAWIWPGMLCQKSNLPT